MSENKELAAAISYRSGGSVKSIASDLGVSQRTIYRWLKEQGVELRPVSRGREYRLTTAVELYENNLTVTEISEAVGVSEHTVVQYLKEADVYISPRDERRDEILALYASGFGVDEIAERVQCVPQTVKNNLELEAANEQAEKL